MRPALSVIFFTTLSGAGFGLLGWLGLGLVLLQARGAAPAPLQSLHLAALALGMALAIGGLLASLAHLGKPGRAWRAMSQWRSSWLSREGLLALLTLAVAGAVGALLLAGGRAPATIALLGPAGLALALLALATVACTAMIYASLKPIPAWRHALVVPTYLLFALLTGLVLLCLLMALLLHGSDQGMVGLLGTTSVLAAVLVLGKWLYWRDIDRTPLPATRADAVGLPGRTVDVFEHPHTEASYLTREMVFVLARRHARALRLLATALLLGSPLLALGLAAVGALPATWLFGVLTFALLAGAFVERWLFFAQARHLVSLYY